MKPNYLLTSMLAVATVVVTSCSAPKLAQQSTVSDDVYNTTAQAKEYTKPAPVQNAYNDADDEGYGTSDPYYDMDYSSRINRFYYGSAFRPYYDPFYDGYYGYNGYSPYYGSGFSFGLGLGFGWGNPFYSSWYSPYSWGMYDPFWGFNNYYGGAYGGFYGGGYYGGGYYGGGYGGGYYSGNYNNSPRPDRGRENGVGYPRGNSNYGSGTTRTTNGVSVSNTRRSDRSGNSTTNSAPRPTRTQDYTPPQRTESSRPTYTPPPASYGGGRSESSGSSGGGSTGGGGGRSSRGGRN